MLACQHDIGQTGYRGIAWRCGRDGNVEPESRYACCPVEDLISLTASQWRDSRLWRNQSRLDLGVGTYGAKMGPDMVRKAA